MHPIVLLVLDGLGDRAYESLGGRSANEAASTPNLDRLFARGSAGLLHPLGPGRSPSTELAHWEMLGYRRDEFPGRAVLEARGRLQTVDPDHVLAYAALRPARRADDRLWLTGRAGREDEDDASVLIGACETLDVEPFTFRLTGVGRGEAVLRIAGGADDRVTDTDSFFRERHPVLRPAPLVDAARATADAVERWTREVVGRLAGHRANAARLARGRPALNVITLKWWGRLRVVPSFEERFGLRGALIGASPFLAGLARTLGLNAVSAPESSDAAADLRGRIALVHERLDAGDTFVLCHQKTLDEAGHTKNPHTRIEAIEQLDSALGGLPHDRAVVCITGDHATPCSPEVIHSGDPVPFVLLGPGVRADNARSFSELDCARGILGHLRGSDVMPVTLNAADRPLFLGSRPTRVHGAGGFPSRVDPLTLSDDAPGRAR